MKVIETSSNSVVNSQEFTKKAFGVKSKNLHYLIGLLRNDLYSDKLLACIREYSCNGQDANVDAGHGDVPIKITLPTKLDSTLRIRDFGCGLSEKDIEEIFISYGESTKRNSNDTVGQMGLGSKAGFCYGDSFRVTSYNNGIKTVYDMVLDKNDVGDCLTLLSEPMKPSEKEGIEVAINIKTGDIELLRQKALSFFKYWNVIPEISGYTQAELKKIFEAKTKVVFGGTDWSIFEEENGYNSYDEQKGVAVMGNIPYPIDWRLVRFESIKNEDFGINANMFSSLLEYFKGARLVLKLKIGAVQFAPSREALQYTDYTNKSIIEKVKVVLGEIQKCVQDKIANAKTLNEAHEIYGELFSGYSGLHRIAPYFKDRLLWNKVAINSDELEGLNNFDAINGFQDGGWYSDHTPIFTSYSTSGDEIRKDGKYQRHVAFSKGTKMMVYDTEKKSYIRKAIHYIRNQNPTDIKHIVVFRFANQKSRDVAFTKLHLDKYEMIKYSEIHEAVKKTIIRGHGQVSASKDSTIRDVKFINPKDHATSYDSFRNHSWNTEETDFSTAEGYYIPLAYNDPKFASTNIHSINSLCCFVQQFNKKYAAKQITKIYGFGPRVTESKLFDATKWTNVETYIEKELNTLLDDDNFMSYISWLSILEKRDWSVTPSFLNNIIVRITVKDTAFHQLLEISKKLPFSVENGAEHLIYDIISNVSKIMTKINASPQHKEITDILNTIKKKYPLLEVCDSFKRGERYVSGKWAPYTDYINLVG